jgi:hypothetical protein
MDFAKMEQVVQGGKGIPGPTGAIGAKIGTGFGYWWMGCLMGFAWKCCACEALFISAGLNAAVAGGIGMEAVTGGGSLRGTLGSLSVISWLAFLHLHLVTPGFFLGFSGMFVTTAPDNLAAFLALYVQ